MRNSIVIMSAAMLAACAPQQIVVKPAPVTSAALKTPEENIEATLPTIDSRWQCSSVVQEIRAAASKAGAELVSADNNRVSMLIPWILTEGKAAEVSEDEQRVLMRLPDGRVLSINSILTETVTTHYGPDPENCYVTKKPKMSDERSVEVAIGEDTNGDGDLVLADELGQMEQAPKVLSVPCERPTTIQKMAGHFREIYVLISFGGENQCTGSREEAIRYRESEKGQ